MDLVYDNWMLQEDTYSWPQLVCKRVLVIVVISIFGKLLLKFCSMQVEGFLKLMQKQIQSTGKRGFFSKKSVGPQVREKFTFEDMLCFQKVKVCCVSLQYILIYELMKS